MSNKSILHVVNIYFVLPYFIGDQFLYFNNKGYKLHVICSPSEHIHNYALEKKFSYKEISILRSISILQDIKSIVLICKYIKSNKIDIVCGHTPKGALLSMIAASIMRVPKRIYFRHGLVYETSNKFQRNLLIFLDRITSKFATKIVCVSPSVYKCSLEDKLNEESKQIILGKGTCGGIDSLNKFNPDKIDFKKLEVLRRQLKLSSSNFVLGYCGRLVKDKGIIDLIDAFNKLSAEQKSEIKILLVGDYEERDALPAEITVLINNDDNIIKTGFIYSDIEYYYSLMNVFILPSYREGFPTSVLEASAMKLPVLTTRVSGCIDSIIDGETGFFDTSVGFNAAMSGNFINVGDLLINPKSINLYFESVKT